MKLIEMMMSKNKGKYGKEAEDMEEGEMEEGYGEEGESEDESETKVTIKLCGKDALERAHKLLMGSMKKWCGKYYIYWLSVICRAKHNYLPMGVIGQKS